MWREVVVIYTPPDFLQFGAQRGAAALAVGGRTFNEKTLHIVSQKKVNIEYRTVNIEYCTVNVESYSEH